MFPSEDKPVLLHTDKHTDSCAKWQINIPRLIWIHLTHRGKNECILKMSNCKPRFVEFIFYHRGHKCFSPANAAFNELVSDAPVWHSHSSLLTNVFRCIFKGPIPDPNINITRQGPKQSKHSSKISRYFMFISWEISRTKTKQLRLKLIIAHNSLDSDHYY